MTAVTSRIGIWSRLNVGERVGEDADIWRRDVRRRIRALELGAMVAEAHLPVRAISVADAKWDVHAGRHAPGYDQGEHE